MAFSLCTSSWRQPYQLTGCDLPIRSRYATGNSRNLGDGPSKDYLRGECLDYSIWILNDFGPGVFGMRALLSSGRWGCLSISLVMLVGSMLVRSTILACTLAWRASCLVSTLASFPRPPWGLPMAELVARGAVQVLREPAEKPRRTITFTDTTSFKR